MRIRVLRNLGTGLPPFKEGQVVDCKTEVAEDLVARGLAEMADGRQARTEGGRASAEGTKPEEPKKEPK